MEGAFERAALAGGLGRQAVAAEVAVPFPVFGIAEIRPAVVDGLHKPIEIYRLARIAVSHQGGDDHLVVRPPQLHIVLIGLRRLAQAIHEIEQPAVLLIPAGVDGIQEETLRLFMQGGVAQPVGFFHQKPGAFDVVPRIHHPAGGDIAHEFPVWADGFQRAAQVLLAVIGENIMHALRGTLVVQRLTLRIGPAQDA